MVGGGGGGLHINVCLIFIDIFDRLFHVLRLK